jgi:uncharacterized protein (TIGR03435 family)
MKIQVRRPMTSFASWIPFLVAGVALAQELRRSTEFEVASVKLAAPQTGGGVFVGVRGGPGTKDPTRINYVNESLRNLLTEAYGVRAYQVSGPDWIDTERYDITARIAEGATKDQVRLMLQKLLAERFKAMLHREIRDFPVFELTVAKSGSKLRPSLSAPPTTTDNSKGPNPIGSDGFPQLAPGATGMMGAMHNGISRLIAGKQTLGALASVLENELGSKVFDKTGFTGTYDFTLDYVRDQGRAISQFKGLPVGSAAADDSGEAPGISTALQEQLGLRLVKTKGPLDVIVVDQASKTPTDN